MIQTVTAADLTKLLAWGPVKIKSIHGWNAQSTDLYIQIFSNSVTIIGGGTTSPTMEALLAQANNGFFYELDITLPMANYAISTTENVYTAVGANGGIRATFDIDSEFAADGTEVKVTGSGVTDLSIWAESAAPPTAGQTLKRLLRLEVTTADATALYALLYAVDTPVAGSLIVSAPLFAGSATNYVLLGDAQCGLIPFQQDANYTKHGGCHLQMSDTYVAAHQYGGSAPSMIALYK